jgi:hypothetical protein
MMRIPVCVLVAVPLGFAEGCRTMPDAPRPVESTRTYHAAMDLDPNPHVLTITTFRPTVPWLFGSPPAFAATAVGAILTGEFQNVVKTSFDRRLGYHVYGHVVVELKTVDPATHEPVYLVTSVTDADPGEARRLLFQDKIGLSLAVTGTEGKIQSPAEAATIVDEPAEIGVHAARLRFLLSPESAAAMLAHYREFVDAGIYKRYSLTAYPFHRDGAGCSSLAVSFLDVGGVLTPEMMEAWRVSIHAPDHLFGDPEAGHTVPVWRLAAYFLTHFRWPETDYRPVVFYDTMLMYRYTARLAKQSGREQGDGDRDLAEYLSIPTATLDARPCVPRPVVPGEPTGVGDLRFPPLSLVQSLVTR